MLFSGTDPESYVTEHTLVHEDNFVYRHDRLLPHVQLWMFPHTQVMNAVTKHVGQHKSTHVQVWEKRVFKGARVPGAVDVPPRLARAAPCCDPLPPTGVPHL